MAFEYKTRYRVEFAETDMAGIVHFSQYFKYMEEAEHEFWRSLGFSVHQESGDDVIGWPRVSADCEYLAPLRFEDEFEVHLQVLEKNEKSLRFGFEMNAISPEMVRIARGHISVVCVRLNKATNQMNAIPIPSDIYERIELAP